MQLPTIAKRLIELFNLSPQAASKYRMALRASPLAGQMEFDELEAA